MHMNQCSRCYKQAAFSEFKLQLYNISTKYSEKNVLFKLSDVVKYFDANIVGNLTL